MTRQLFSVILGLSEEKLCWLLHIILILLYMVLVIIASKHYEHGLNFPFSPTGQTTVSVTVAIISQGFGTVSTFKYIHDYSIT